MKLSEVKPGMYLTVDKDFTCMVTGIVYEVFKNNDDLFVNCKDGIHYLSGETMPNDELIGFTEYPSLKEESFVPAVSLRKKKKRRVHITKPSGVKSRQKTFMVTIMYNQSVIDSTRTVFTHLDMNDRKGVEQFMREYKGISNIEDVLPAIMYVRELNN